MGPHDEGWNNAINESWKTGGIPTSRQLKNRTKLAFITTWIDIVAQEWQVQDPNVGTHDYELWRVEMIYRGYSVDEEGAWIGCLLIYEAPEVPIGDGRPGETESDASGADVMLR